MIIVKEIFVFSRVLINGDDAVVCFDLVDQVAILVFKEIEQGVGRIDVRCVYITAHAGVTGPGFLYQAKS